MLSNPYTKLLYQKFGRLMNFKPDMAVFFHLEQLYHSFQISYSYEYAIRFILRIFILGCTVFNIIAVVHPDPEMEPFPQQYATALFSFLYHLASYENGKKYFFFMF